MDFLKKEKCCPKCGEAMSVFASHYEEIVDEYGEHLLVPRLVTYNCMNPGCFNSAINGVIASSPKASLTSADVDILSGSTNRRVRYSNEEDKEVKRLYTEYRGR